MSAHSHPGDKPSWPASAKYEFELPVSAEREEADKAGDDGRVRGNTWKNGFQQALRAKDVGLPQPKEGGTAIQFTAMPGRHGPAVAAKLLPDVMGSILDFTAQGQNFSYRMYISGDTMVNGEIREIPGAILTWILRYCTWGNKDTRPCNGNDGRNGWREDDANHSTQAGYFYPLQRLRCLQVSPKRFPKRNS